MTEHDWMKDFPASINICDKNGTLIYLNKKAAKSFEKEGGDNLLGTNIIDCHPPGKSREKLFDMLENRSINYYMIEKNNMRKFIYQAPWYDDGEFMGIAEIVMEIPGELLLHKRD